MNDRKYNYSNEELFDFIKNSPTAFHACHEISKLLDSEGFMELKENEKWNVSNSGKYYVTRNGSSIIAIALPEDLNDLNIQITVSHSDSPRFKLKENSLIEIAGNYTKLNAEGYGGMICSSWLDRPLSIAGRITYKNNEGIYKTSLVNIDEDMVLIPSVAIHMNRNTNENQSFNKQIDMPALLSGDLLKKEDFDSIILKYARKENENIEEILGSDLYIYNRCPASIWGANKEFISAPQLDNLQCAYGTLLGFLNGTPKKSINVYACFDNEEVGSETRQSAASTFLEDVLKRLFMSLKLDREEYSKAISKGFMVSADNAHAVHPNHPELTDAKNNAFMNKGIVIKVNASQKYTTEGLSSGIFQDLCKKVNVPVQHFANRSDKAGGSTLGNISSLNIPLLGVDIGLPQLAMHSSYETAGSKDGEYLVKAISEFYSKTIKYE